VKVLRCRLVVFVKVLGVLGCRISVSQFLKLLARGCTPAAARREVGIGRSTSRNWRNGISVRLKHGIVRFVPSLDPLTTAVISPLFLSEAERIEVADLRHSGATIRVIAAAIGHSPPTISRELRRNCTREGRYQPVEAHRVRRTAPPRRRPNSRKIFAELLTPHTVFTLR
jgi:transposase, IS30 family